MHSIKQTMLIRLIFLIFSFHFLTAALAADGEQAMTLNLKSSGFTHLGDIPKVFTCDGKDISPSLSWTDVPQNTKSLVLIVDDPDAPDPANPKMTWVHWILYNIPPTVSALPEAVAAADLPAGTKHGKNDWHRTGYGGPCPPIGSHRYFHKLYSLDIELPDLHEPTKSQLEAAMAGHILDHTELVGTYQR
jgi:Raf kinase inhibitor-like YbhB/YbcL family protein